MLAHTFIPSTGEAEADLWEFKASPVYQLVSSQPGLHSEILLSFTTTRRMQQLGLGIVLNTCNHSTWEVETGGFL